MLWKRSLGCYECTELGIWSKWTRYIAMVFLELRLKTVCDFMIQVSGFVVTVSR